jgi:hypothetical protein
MDVGVKMEKSRVVYLQIILLKVVVRYRESMNIEYDHSKLKM